MSNILELKNLREGMALSECIVYIQNYTKKSYQDGKKFYILGTFAHQKDSVIFKIWDTALVEVLGENDISGKVVKVTGSVTSYLGNIEIKVQSIDINVEPQYTPTLFLRTIDVEEVYKEFVELVNTELTQKGVKVLMGIFKAEDIFGRFKEEFAGNKMHDALVGGLMNHTVKMLRYAKVLVQNEPRILELEDYKDLLMLGVILHDIGKVKEMKLGVYQENSFVTHRTIGVEMISRYKDIICQVYNETFYYQILAIIQGHHGPYGDKPTTLMAYIVHLIDMIDAMTTGAFDKIENNDMTTRAGHKTIYMQDGYLTVE